MFYFHHFDKCFNVIMTYLKFLLNKSIQHFFKKNKKIKPY